MPQVRIFQHREYPWWIVWAVLIGRFVSGREMNGYRVTDATWTKHGLNTLTGRPGWWGHLPYSTRTMVRFGVLLVIILAPVGLIFDWQNTVDTLQIIAIFGVSIGLWAWFDWAFRKAHKNNYVRPLAYALGPIVGWPSRKRAEDWVHVPRTDHRNDPNRFTVIDMPTGFALPDAQIERIQALCAKRLDIKNPTFTWEHKGQQPKLFVQSGTVIPLMVKFDEDIKKLITEASFDQFIVGKGKNGEIIRYSLKEESPHVALSMASGGGKSVFVMLVAAQAMYKGMYVYIGDSVKRGASHFWAKYIDRGVTTLTSTQTLCEGLETLGAEVERRMDRYYKSDGKEQFQPILFILEEANLTMPEIQRHYKRMGNKGALKDLPAIVGLTQIIQAGRQAQIFLLTVAQRFDASVAGGGQARESYGIKVLGRYSRAAAKMLMNGPKYPDPSFHPGRVQLVLGAKETEMQVILLNDLDAQSLSVDGEPCPDELFGLGHLGQSPVSPGNQAHGTWDTVEEETLELLTLSDAIDQGVITGLNIEALRKASRRDTFPDPKSTGIRNAKMYDRVELEAWEVRRNA